MLTGGIPPILQSVAQSPQNATLRAGQTYSALVRAQNGALVAQIGASQVPLPEGAALAAGQRVYVHVLSAGSTLQLEIAPAGGTAPAANPSPAPPIDALLRPIFQSLGKAALLPRAGPLLPPQLPASNTTLQPVLTVLLSDRGLARELQQLQQVFTAATAQGAVPADTAAAVARWLGLAPGAAGESWRQLLDRTRAERAVAARIAQSLGNAGGRSGLAGLRDSAASLSERLMKSDLFTSWLRERGELEPFRALAQRIQERALGGDLQNLRTLDQPYQFLELPVRESEGFRRAHLHSFSEEHGGGGGHGRTTTHRTILDIDTTRLGPLWIALQATAGQCTCQIRAASPEVAELLAHEAADLQRALESAGYTVANVAIEPWDGNREEALLHLLAPYQKLDLEG